MKKFLSLVLAMIMTMSLVTISAGATEYKDLTDKSEIQYAEAVAVLNRIGVITGYEDGTFRPETELTRGAAAKIIVSLMIGPDAANALPNASSPYPDVPASHTFAGVISYCKTAGYISGYGDGTFKPANPLTGYAFAKMLLGAVGYNSDIEGFTGTGWTMNVAKVGNIAGLFDRISFDGAAAVTRDQACQLALNTLKATMVTYGGTTIINGSTGAYTMQGTVANPVTSNNRDINANIGRKDWYGGNNQGSDYLTLEFGEEHFKDLRLEYDKYDPAHDEFGRPSNQWSYKKVTIGTFALPADFTYTTQVAHRETTDSNKEKALGLRNYDLIADGGYSVWSGWGNTGDVVAGVGGRTTLWLNGVEKNYLAANTSKVADIADYTDNGTLVEVYVSYMDADWITDVVVIQTQLMEVEKIGSDYVALKRETPDAKKGNLDGEAYVGYNQAGIDVEVDDVKDANEDAYELLKGLKEGDAVAIIPVSNDDGATWEVAEAYVPETVSGSWSRVDTYGIGNGNKERNAISMTVGGTEYKISDWHKKMYDKTDVDIKATRGDVTLLLDKYGFALKAKGIGDTNGFMVIGDFYQSLVNNKICTFVHGWDIGGKEIDINLGSNLKMTTHGNTKVAYGHELGELVKYSSAEAVGDADYALIHSDVHSVFYWLDKNGVVNKDDPAYEIKTNNVRLYLATANGNTSGHFCDAVTVQGMTLTDDSFEGYTFASDVKFIYVNYTEGDEVDSIEIKEGRQNVSTKELAARIASGIYAAQASVKDGKITSVVIKAESSDAKLNQILYVIKHTGYKEVDSETGNKAIGIIAARFNNDGKFESEVEMVIDKDLAIGAWASYNDRGEISINGKTIDNYYHVKSFTRHNTNPAVLYADNVAPVLNKEKDEWFDYLLDLNGSGDDRAVYSVDANGNKNIVLAPDADNDGKGATDATSYLLSYYRSYNDVVNKYSEENVRGVIWTQDAYWLNMTNDKTYDKIDSAEDLTDLIDQGAKVSVTVLLNENPDSDGFRMAQLIVINSVSFAGGTSSGSTANNKNGTDFAFSYKINANGSVPFTLALTRPSWVPDTADVKVKAAVYVDDMLVSDYYDKLDGSTKLIANGNATISSNKKTVTYSGLAYNYFFSASETSVIKIVVDSIVWDEVKVEATGATGYITDLAAKQESNAAITMSFKLTNTNVKVGSTVVAKQGDTVLGKYTFTGNEALNGVINLDPETGATVDPTKAITVEFNLAPATVTVDPVVTTDLTSAPKNLTNTGNSKANAYVAAIKALPVGAYVAPAIPQSEVADGDNPMYRGGKDVADEDCIVIVYPKTGIAGETYTLVIDNTTVFSEDKTDSIGVNENGFFHVQVNDNHSTYFANSGNGSMTETALASGKHNYTITDSRGNTMQSGSFEIKKEGLNGDLVTGQKVALDAAPEGATAEQKDAHYEKAVLALNKGVYEMPDVAETVGESSWLYIGDTDASNVLVWVFDTKAGETVTIELFNSDRELKHKESLTADGTSEAFIIQVKGDSVWNTEAANPSLNAALSGNCAYRITGVLNGTTRTISEGTVRI